MTSALIIYLILTQDHRWEFLAIERTDSRAYCDVISEEVRSIFSDKPGNIRVLCTEDEEWGI